MRVTAACPVAMTPQANNLAMCLGHSVADGLTFAKVAWQDAAGNLYACASFEASDEWIQSAQSPLARPEWDADGIIDMDAANAAQAALVFWVLNSETAPPSATTSALTAIGGMNGLDAIEVMGLSKSE